MPRHRVGIAFGPVGDLNTIVTSYLILQLNLRQSMIDFEIVPPYSDDPLWRLLKSKDPISRTEVEITASNFKDRYGVFWDLVRSRTPVSEDQPPYIIVVTLAHFSDNLYSTSRNGVAILAFGNWKRHMAPPSLVEFIVAFVLRIAAGLIDPRLANSRHIGAKGCLWDYNYYLRDTRYKVLLGYVCDDCRLHIENGPLREIAGLLHPLAPSAWIGSKSDPLSPAAIAAKLGYDLFVTKGPRPTLRESIATLLREEAVKEAVKWIFAFLLAGAIFLVKWK